MQLPEAALRKLPRWRRTCEESSAKLPDYQAMSAAPPWPVPSPLSPTAGLQSPWL